MNRARICWVLQVREEAYSLDVVNCWVEEASFIAAGSYPFPRNPNGFYSIWPNLFLSFSSPPLTFPILVKLPLPICTKSGILGAQGPFAVAALVKNCYSQPSPFLSFLPFFMVRSDEGKKWVYLLVRRVAPSLARCVPIFIGPLDVFA
ncbi:unnamed protein product [Prunus armeniaca]